MIQLQLLASHAAQTLHKTAQRYGEYKLGVKMPVLETEIRILFLSFKTLLDRNSGAAIELRAILEAVTALGASAQALTFNCYDTGNDYKVDPEIADELTNQRNVGRLFHIEIEGVRHYLQPATGLHTLDIDQRDFETFLHNSEQVIASYKPTHVLFFGSNELLPILKKAKSAKIVMYVGTASYEKERKPLFDISDKVIVPSDFIGELCKKKFQKQCYTIQTSLPFSIPDIDIERKSRERKSSFISIVNPAADKGGHVVFAIAKNMPNLSNRFLAVESRATARFWQSHGYDLSSISNLWWAPWQPDISTILEKSALLLMPSLVNEAAGKIISEAMAFGVPTIAFDRGGIAQQMRGTGVLLECKDEFKLNKETQKYNIYPSQIGISSWTDAITNTLNDKNKYQEMSSAAKSAAAYYDIAKVSKRWLTALNSI